MTAEFHRPGAASIGVGFEPWPTTGAGWWGAAAEFLRWSSAAQDVWLAGCSSADAIAERARQRMRELLAHAAGHSPFYRDLYRGIDLERTPFAALPTVTRTQLMAQFDRWVVDPRVRRADVETFIADPQRIGMPFLGDYAVWTSSGTSGIPGIYLHDPWALAVHEALSTTRFGGALGNGPLWTTLLSGGRLALVVATGGHFAAISVWERMRRRQPWLAARARSFSILQPLASLVASLNDCAPTFLSSYPTMLALLAREQVDGRLDVRPTAIWSGGECLPPAEAQALREAFGCPVIEEYGASECMAIASACGYGTLHLNADWVMLEPVDERGRPVPDGQASASVLLTDLANRIQPLIRYDLGDSVTVHTERCRCGSPFPAISVDGRRDDVLHLPALDGSICRLLPLAVCTLLEEQCGLHRFQLIQTAADALSLRFEPVPRQSAETTWRRVRATLQRWFESLALAPIRLTHERQPLQASSSSGKLRQVIGWRAPRLKTAAAR